MKKIYLLFLLMFLSLLVNAHIVEIDGINYNLNTEVKTAEVIAKSSGEYSGGITIPSIITYDGTDYDVTSIGDEAFRDCDAITSINIPNSIINIGNYAFRDCEGLISITIPNSVKSMGIGAFLSCNKLTSVTISNSITAIEDNTFLWCNVLSSVTIPNSVTSIGNYAFSDCISLSSITIPNSVTSIATYAFRSCRSLTSVTIPNSVTSIGSWCFSGCKNIESLKVERGNSFYYSPDDCDAIIEISTNRLIVGCKKTIIPSTVTSIGDGAFSGCSDLTSITIPNSVTSIGKSAFRSCSGLASVTMGNSMISIGSEAFGYCDALTDVTCLAEVLPITEENAFFKSHQPHAILYVPASAVKLYKATEPWNGFKKIVAVDGTEVPDEEVITHTKRTINVEVAGTFPTLISDAEKYDIDELILTGELNGTDFRLLRDMAGNNYLGKPTNGKLKTLDLTNAKIVSGGMSYLDTNWISCFGGGTTVDKTKAVFQEADKLPYMLFAGCKLHSVKIPQGVKIIGERAFYFCNALTKITIPNSVTIIENSTFWDCNLTSITIPNSVTSIDDGAFGWNNNLETIRVENGNGTYYSPNDCNAIIEISSNKLILGCVNTIIPVGVTSIGSGAFRSCTFTSIDIPNSVKSIGSLAFSECNNLTSIKIPNGVTKIEMQAFSYCYNLKSLSLPNSIQSIGFGAFMACYDLTSITLSNNIKIIDSQAFRDCFSLKYVVSHIKNPFSIVKNVFSNITSDAILTVPYGSKPLYSSTEGWNAFKNIVEMAAISIGKSGKISYCGDQSLDFSFSEEVKAYIATGFDKDEGTIWLTRVKDVPAGVPVLIKGEADKTYDVPVTDSQNSYYMNMFKGNISGAAVQISETEGDLVNYYLSSDGVFKSVKGYANIGNNKCYLQLPGTFNAAVEGSSQAVTVGASGKASYAAPVDLDFTNVEGLKVFTATGYDKSTKTIWLTRVMKVQKGEGLLLKGDAKDYEIPSAAVQSSYMNMFVGNTSGDQIQVQEKSEDGTQTNYYLKGDGSFVSVNGFVNIGNNKCYLELPTSMVAVAASTRGVEKSYKFEEPEMIKLPISFRSISNDEDGTTGIKDQPSKFNAPSDAYYTLQGQRVQNPGKGLYIKNGRKVVIK